jgi:SAM-dependent methyltransferase
MEGHGTVSATGIAKMAGVGRAAVSNWRRRYPNFPPAVGGTTTSPAFDLAAVENWLSEQGKLPDLAPNERLWRLIETTDMADALCLVGMLLFTGIPTATCSPDELTEAVATKDKDAATLLAGTLPVTWSGQHRDLLRAVGELAADTDPGELFEYLHSRFVAARGSSADLTTPRPLARLMVDLAGPGIGVLDFACGTGTLLKVAAECALDAKRPVRCFAQDVNASAARITQLRLLFTQIKGAEPHVVRAGDSLLADAFPDLAADVVVANAPFGLQGWGHEQLAYDPRWMFGGLPPRTEPELAWVQHALAHLKPGGHAVLLMPPAAATRPAGRRIRGELLRRGALQAVIALPPGLLPSTSVGLHLWLLRRPLPDQRTASHVLFVDTAANLEPRAAVDMVVVIGTATTAWKEFTADPASVTEMPGVRRAVPVIDLLDDETDVSPQRHLPLPQVSRQDPGDLLATRAAFATQLDALRAGIPTLAARGGFTVADARYVTLEELVKNEYLEIVRAAPRGTGKSEEDASGEVPAVTGIDAARGNPPSGTIPRSRSYAAGEIREGDVLVPQVGESVIARVATPEQVGAQLGATAQVLRVNADVLDPWFLAGVLSTAENTRTAIRHSSTMAGAMRINVKRLQIPVLPLEAQRQTGDAFRLLSEFERALALVADQGRSLAREFTEGLAAGVLAPGTNSITACNN